MVIFLQEVAYGLCNLSSNSLELRRAALEPQTALLSHDMSISPCEHYPILEYFFFLPIPAYQSIPPLTNHVHFTVLPHSKV